MQHTQTLTLVTQWYNQLQSTILAVEVGLVKDEMDKTKLQLEPTLHELTWAQDDLWDYIQSTRDMVKVLNIQSLHMLMLMTRSCSQSGQRVWRKSVISDACWENIKKTCGSS